MDRQNSPEVHQLALASAPPWTVCLSKGSLTVIFNLFCEGLHRFQDQHTPQPVSGERGAGWEVRGKDVPQREKLGEEGSASSESAEGREGNELLRSCPLAHGRPVPGSRACISRHKPAGSF